jgi:hypothetical protein
MLASVCHLRLWCGCLQVFFYTISGARSPKQVSFGPELEAEGVSHVAMYADGFVVIGAKSCQLWAVAGLQEPRATRLPRIPGLGILQGGSSSSSSSSSNVAGGNAGVGAAAADREGGQSGNISVCLAVLEPRFTLSSGLEVGREWIHAQQSDQDNNWLGSAVALDWQLQHRDMRQAIRRCG